MALEKTITDDRLEVVGDYKSIQVRTATIVSEDGVESKVSPMRRGRMRSKRHGPSFKPRKQSSLRK